MDTKFKLYTVPGQVYYNSTRKLVLQGADGVVFVADSQRKKLQENIESLENLQTNLKEYGLDLGTIAFILQYNKRDLPDVMSIEEMNEKLNPWGVPHFEAIAFQGVGVFPTLKALVGLVLSKVNAPAAGAASPPKRPATVSAAVPGMAQTPAPPSSPMNPMVQTPPVGGAVPTPRTLTNTPSSGAPPIAPRITSNTPSAPPAMPPRPGMAPPPPRPGMATPPPSGGSAMPPRPGGMTPMPPGGGSAMPPRPGGMTPMPPGGGSAMPPRPGGMAPPPPGGGSAMPPRPGGMAPPPPRPGMATPPPGGGLAMPPRPGGMAPPPRPSGMALPPSAGAPAKMPVPPPITPFKKKE